MMLNPRSVSIYLGILGGLGFAILLDIVLFLKLVFLIGPWIMMTILAALTAFNLLLTYSLTAYRNEKLMGSIHGGRYDASLFSRYIATLFAGIFLIPPGLANTVVGLVLLLPPVSQKFGNALAGSSDHGWTEAYEYLRLNAVMTSHGENGT